MFENLGIHTQAPERFWQKHSRLVFSLTSFSLVSLGPPILNPYPYFHYYYFRLYFSYLTFLIPVTGNNKCKKKKPPQKNQMFPKTEHLLITKHAFSVKYISQLALFWSQKFRQRPTNKYFQIQTSPRQIINTLSIPLDNTNIKVKGLQRETLHLLRIREN